MSETNATAKAIPQLTEIEAVAAARKQRDELTAELNRARKELDSATKIDPIEAAARAMVGDDRASKQLQRINELRAKEPVLVKAIEYANQAVETAEREAVRELSPAAIQTRFDPAVRKAASCYLQFVESVVAVRKAAAELDKAGYSVPLHPIGRDLPTEVVHGSNANAILQRMIDTKLLDRAAVQDALPELFAYGWIK